MDSRQKVLLSLGSLAKWRVTARFLHLRARHYIKIGFGTVKNRERATRFS
jgi:hypothetical protein